MSATKRGRGKALKTIAILNAAVRILKEIQPCSVRAVCYRLFTQKLIPSMERKYTNSISRLLVHAREQGIVKWNWIVDDTRAPMGWATYETPEEFLDEVRDRYCRDAWGDQEIWVEVWSEKATIKGTLMPVLEKYAVGFTVMHGHASASAIYRACALTRQRERRLIVLYVGDWDPSGLHMSEADLPGRIRRYGGDIEVKRIAISEFDTHPGEGIPHFDPGEKIKDPRYRWFMDRYATKCFELDAMNPVDLRHRVEDRITGLLDLDAWDHSIAVGKAELDSMRDYFDRWPGISMPAHKYS